jgi:hypothetical protein
MISIFVVVVSIGPTLADIEQLVAFLIALHMNPPHLQKGRRRKAAGAAFGFRLVRPGPYGSLLNTFVHLPPHQLSLCRGWCYLYHPPRPSTSSLKHGILKSCRVNQIVSIKRSVRSSEQCLFFCRCGRGKRSEIVPCRAGAGFDKIQNPKLRKRKSCHDFTMARRNELVERGVHRKSQHHPGQRRDGHGQPSSTLHYTSQAGRKRGPWKPSIKSFLEKSPQTMKQQGNQLVVILLKVI